MSKNLKTRILVFGTFDVLHPGHINFFQQARRLAKNPFLIVSVARDINVLRIKNKKPKFYETIRLKQIKKCKLVDKSLLGAKKNYLLHIKNQKPKIVALGHDQSVYTENLDKKLKIRGIKAKIVRLSPFYRKKFRSSLYK